ncbi:MAG TPA: hypothetical protein VHF69_11620, partial [Candidatus Synoicihabitans sp.]|nr:hypothetical protein [Candidatus Synoicihabitans sp.]
YIIGNSELNGALLADPLIVAYLNNPANQDAIRNGELPELVAGLRFAKYPAMATTDSNLVGFSGTPDALLYMARAPKTPDEVFAGAASRAPFSWSVIIEPNTGFAVMVQQWVETDLSIHTRLVWLDGYSIGNRTNLVRIVKGAVAGTAGEVVSIRVENPGYGYRDNTGAFAAPDVTITGGGGADATATATIDAVGAVTGITVTAAGTGYTGTPSVVIEPVSGGRADAPATAAATVAGLK